MTADEQLHGAYREWRRLAEAEGEAIRTGNWSLVTDCQNALQHLQPQIIRHLEQAQAEWEIPGADRATKENAFRSVVAELIQLEWRNNTLLNAARQAAQARMEQLDQSGRTLRRVQRSYAPLHSSGWTSLS